ncbi:calcitonin gene-related peptide type 1 receptor-like [Pantherophis guttatus]|uniref:Calcitonin gene-related peptide type 1 receptor-like n=1 Tax=Pantherophis guttatus TaxID=94885 RepID=A0ABM3Z4B4_PANGU|nr:calcitonin gene-related peptide type 1 receptor-like [Pantherophis guttatus]
MSQSSPDQAEFYEVSLESNWADNPKGASVSAYGATGSPIILLFMFTDSVLKKLGNKFGTQHFHLRQEMKTEEIMMKAQFECYQKFIQVPVHENTGSYCNRTWDGWLCWDDTPAGETATQNCPPYFQDFDYLEKAFKICEENGHWFVHPESKRQWTNYTLCSGNYQDVKSSWNAYYIAITGLSLSFVSLLISLGIFLCFKSLSCPRVSLHKNLFFSFICNCVMSLTLLGGIVQQHRLVATPPVCKVLQISQLYFFLCNFFWMMSEGIYLYIVTVVNVFAKRQALRWYYFLGWGVPLIHVSTYAVARSLYFNDYCWYTTGTLLSYTIDGPIYTVLLT